MTSATTSTKLEALLRDYPEIQIFNKNKLKCQLTGHEMPRTVEDVETYINGSKFKRAHRLNALMTKYGQYFEDKGPTKLYCKITRRTIAKEGVEIERHISGSRFQRALAKFGAASNDNEQRMDFSDEDEDETALRNNNNNNNDLQFIEDEEKASDVDDEIETSESAEESDLNDLYPELDNSDDNESDFDFRAMDTDLDGGAGSKRKLDNAEMSNDVKKKRNK